MIRLLSLLLVLLLPCLVMAQPKGKPAKHAAKHHYGRGVVAVAPEPVIYTVVEQRPEFPGGEAALERYLSLNMIYPPMARENEIQGKVLVRFMVEDDGSIGHVEVMKGIGYGCDQEAVRVVKAMPHWRPGKYNGKPVKAVYMLPLYFHIER